MFCSLQTKAILLLHAIVLTAVVALMAQSSPAPPTHFQGWSQLLPTAFYVLEP